MKLLTVIAKLIVVREVEGEVAVVVNEDRNGAVQRQEALPTTMSDKALVNNELFSTSDQEVLISSLEVSHRQNGFEESACSAAKSKVTIPAKMALKSQGKKMMSSERDKNRGVLKRERFFSSA